MDTDDLHTDATQRSLTAKQARDVEVADIKTVMSSKQGRRFARRLLAMAGVYRTSFTGNSETFFREGKRALGLEIVAELTAHTPEEYLMMLKEGMTK